MITIHKYTLPRRPVSTDVEMPADAQILCCQAQHGQIQIWAKCENEHPAEIRTFYVFETGQRISSTTQLAYIGTVQFDDGERVFHVFEKE